MTKPGEIRYLNIADALPPRQVKPDDGAPSMKRFVCSSRLKEVELFALLKWRFGPPNGFITFLGRPGGDPDGPYKWDYVFRPTELMHLQVIRTVSGVELWWWGIDATPEDIVCYINHNLVLHKGVIKESIGSLEEYTLILNPYARHKSLVDLASEQLDSVQPEEPRPPISIQVPQEYYIEYGEKFSKYCSETNRQALYSVLLLTESAFMAEAYLNLMLAIYLRPEILRSKSLKKEVLRRRWREKIERLPVDCQFISNAPNMADPRIAKAAELFNLRNRIAHSHPDKSKMKLGTMWFLDCFPVLPKATPFHEFAFALNNQLPSKEEAIDGKEAAQNLITFLSELLDDKMRETFEFIAQANPLGFNETKQIYGVPFGNWAIVAAGPGR